MKGTVSFHPVDLSFFDDVVAPLVGGRKINPEAYLRDALRVRRTWWAAHRWPRALRAVLVAAEPRAADPSSGLWERLRTNLERLDHKPDEVARKAKEKIEPDIHLDGRPFLVGEGSTEKVADAVEAFRIAEGDAAVDRIAREQLARIDPDLARGVEPEGDDDLSADLQHRNDLLHDLKEIHDLARAAREGTGWKVADGSTVEAAQALVHELPWRALRLHAKVVPFWIARDVDGLETICRAAGVMAPDCLVPAWRPFAEACGEFPALKEALHLEITGPRDLGAFVAPDEIPALLEFLNLQGTRIIGAATRHGEGPAATSLLRKIKECAVYAQRRGFGYLEAAGIEPPDVES